MIGDKRAAQFHLPSGGEFRYQLTASQLVEEALINREGKLTSTGALQVLTGKYTGRSPKDRYIVEEQPLASQIDWGKVNQPISRMQFERLYIKAVQYMENRKLYIFDGFAGAEPEHRLHIRVINEHAWHNLFAQQLFIRPSRNELLEHQPEFTVIALPGLQAEPHADGTHSETFIVISFERKVVLIGGTEYAGEMKKSIFSVLNFLLPMKGVLPMHCSANAGERGDVALFFGLSGTGKTTLSADPNRRLVGDDEHGWSERGVFNFEGGLYAKCIGLTEEKEPQIWHAIRYGAVLENVRVDETTRIANYHDAEFTENTRAAFPVEYIPNAIVPGTAGHPNVIVFLTADAFGVLPPVSKLTKEQAMYHFLSGYTSKLAGTERGVTEPEATFSACFGSPFLPLRPEVYAAMLGQKIDRHDVNVYLVNTGWTGGAYGTGRRIPLEYTRKMVTAILTGTIELCDFTEDPVFGLRVPNTLEGIPEHVLHPQKNWPDTALYMQQANELALRFKQNFAKFTNVDESVVHAGPLSESGKH